MASLHTLPPELLLQIYSYLDIPSRTVFPLIHRRLYTTFPIAPLDSYTCNSTRRDILQHLEENCNIFHARYALCYGTTCALIRCAPSRHCPQCNQNHSYVRTYLYSRAPPNIPKDIPPDYTCNCLCPNVTSQPDFPLPNIHPRTRFSTTELLHHSARGPRTRSCLSSSASLIISPSRILSLRHPDMPRHPSRRRNPPESEQDDAGAIEQINIDAFVLRTRYAMLTVRADAVVSPRDVACVLSGFGIPACPHTMVNDPRVLSVYDPGSRAVSGPVLFDLADAEDRVRCRFAKCDTELYWSVRLVEDGEGGEKKKLIYLHVSRVLGTLQSYTDYKFFVQCAVPNTKRLTAAWERSMKWKKEVGQIIAKRYENGDDPLPVPESYHEEPTSEPLLWPVYGPPLSQQNTFESAFKA